MIKGERTLDPKQKKFLSFLMHYKSDELLQDNLERIQSALYYNIYDSNIAETRLFNNLRRHYIREFKLQL